MTQIEPSKTQTIWLPRSCQGTVAATSSQFTPSFDFHTSSGVPFSAPMTQMWQSCTTAPCMCLPLHGAVVTRDQLLPSSEHHTSEHTSDSNTPAPAPARSPLLPAYWFQPPRRKSLPWKETSCAPSRGNHATSELTQLQLYVLVIDCPGLGCSTACARLRLIATSCSLWKI